MTHKIALEKESINIVLLEGIHSKAEEVFHANGFSQVELIKTALTGNDLLDKVANAHLIGVRSRTQVTAEVLEAASHLMAVGCFCIGTNQVDLNKAALQGVPTFNAPHSNTRSVAELVIGQTIMLMRGIFPKSSAAHRGQWQKSAIGSNEVRGKTIGIVGYGHIGTQVSILAESMGMKVLYFDVQTKLPLGNAQPVSTLDELLATVDLVTLHVPQDPTTKLLMNRQRLESMKRGAYLINASRGTVVDIDALADCLESGTIAGAAVDVFPVEPKSNKLPFESRLIGMDQVILTPHIGGSTFEAQVNIGHEVAGKLSSFLDTGTTDGAVNFPNANLPPQKESHRILHIHRNVPGVLRQINDAIAVENINVVGQYLATDNQVGYVVLDIAKDLSDRLQDAIRHIEGTIRTRVLY